MFNNHNFERKKNIFSISFFLLDFYGLLLSQFCPTKSEKRCTNRKELVLLQKTRDLAKQVNAFFVSSSSKFKSPTPDPIGLEVGMYRNIKDSKIWFNKIIFFRIQLKTISHWRFHWTNSIKSSMWICFSCLVSLCDTKRKRQIKEKVEWKTKLENKQGQPKSLDVTRYHQRCTEREFDQIRWTNFFLS